MVPMSALVNQKYLFRQSRRDPLPRRSSGFAMTAAAAAGSGRNALPTTNSWFIAKPVLLGYKKS